MRFSGVLLLLCACAPYVAILDPKDARDAGDPGDGGAASRCVETAASLHCAHHTLLISPGGLGLGNREVHWQVPLGAAPAAGWPVVFMFQGSFFSANTFWDGAPTMPFGGWAQTHVTRALLDQGFAVVTPKTRFDGAYYWDTNVVGFSDNWGASDDHHLMLQLFEELKSTITPIDSARLYATGISSGGYMTSRMAQSYPGRFRALAVAAGSWATCGGPLCSVPNPLPADHPPTLFLHGERDDTVPVETMRAYAAQLSSQGLEAKVVTDPDAGHAWISASPAEVPAWFLTHP